MVDKTDVKGDFGSSRRISNCLRESRTEEGAPSSSAVSKAFAPISRIVAAILALTLALTIRAQEPDAGAPAGPDQSPGSLKKLSLEELMNYEVTSASKHAQRLADAATSIQVITHSDILRSGASNIPEALRLASNLHVARIDSHQWAITARGFNSASANKLLVLIDGRTVYTPLFSGVFWDVQNVLLEDVDRIEVISGPGGTLWGSNAVNGVINIITKSAKDTQGALFQTSIGDRFRNGTAVRASGSPSDSVALRAYGMGFSRDGAVSQSGGESGDAWSMLQGGFRLDWNTSPQESLTFQGDVYDGRIEMPGSNRTTLSGRNLLARYTKADSDESELKVQLYYDSTYRRAPGIITDSIGTLDFDMQRRAVSKSGHDLTWGMGYRCFSDEVVNGPFLAFLPDSTTRRLYSLFAQDSTALRDGKTNLTIGAKLEHNDYTGWEFQPNIRATTKAGPNQTLWAAVSRSVRTPSRIDRELFAPGNPPFLIDGGAGFESEIALAYELGYRSQPTPRFSYSATAFLTDYDKIRSFEQTNPPAPLPIKYGNGFRAKSTGLELNLDYEVSERWRIQVGYSSIDIDFWTRPGSTDPTGGANESNDPRSRLLVKSSMDLPGSVSLDLIYRAISKITTQSVPGYSELDVRLAWSPHPGFEAALIGQNLLAPRHAEFGAANGREYVERGVYGSLTWRF